jgi:hypothetical protein
LPFTFPTHHLLASGNNVHLGSYRLSTDGPACGVRLTKGGSAGWVDDDYLYVGLTRRIPR